MLQETDRSSWGVKGHRLFSEDVLGGLGDGCGLDSKLLIIRLLLNLVDDGSGVYVQRRVVHLLIY